MKLTMNCTAPSAENFSSLGCAYRIGLVGEVVYSASPYFILILIIFWVSLEQLMYLNKKSILPGPSFVIPFLGSSIPLIRNPAQYWLNQSSYANNTPMGVSADYLFGRFVVFIRNSNLSHKILNNVRPDAFLLVVHPLGKKLLEERSIVYKTGQEHKDLRRRIAPCFSSQALAVYSQSQQSIMVKHFAAWERLSSNPKKKPIALRVLVHDMILEISQTLFVGPYLSQEAMEQFNKDFQTFNTGLMKLPVDLPGFAFRSPRLALGRLYEILSSCAAMSKARIALQVENIEPTCLVDYLMQQVRREEVEATSTAIEDIVIGSHLFDFIFAAQDTSTPSLLWAITYLESHPDVLAKVRKEVDGILSSSESVSITAGMLAAMKYTHAVAREILRIHPPGTTIPHIAAKDFPLTETYTIPKGALVLPSLFDSSFQGFLNPDRFDPERFLEGREEDKVHKSNFLVFGSGTHQSVGQRYAINTMVLFIAMFTAMLDFKRHTTDGCDELAYVPAIIPKDGCMVYLSSRVANYPALSIS